MFADLFKVASRKSPESYDRLFIEEVRAPKRPVPRRRDVERLFWLGWVLIVLKCVATVWAVKAYSIPINALWVIAPSLAFAALVTVLYWKRWE